MEEIEKHEQDRELPITAQNDLVLSLLAASELPGKWKAPAITRAKGLSQNIRDYYVRACVAHRESTRHRVLVDPDSSRQAISNFFRDTNLLNDDQLGKVSPKVHAQHGHLTVSSALNSIQREEFNQAIDELESWNPSSPEYPSAMDRVVLYHINITRGKVLRYQGCFHSALRCLMTSLRLAELEDLYDEVKCDLLCNIGDVYSELNDPDSAKLLLQAELNRLHHRGDNSSAESRLLELSLAEAFMRQGLHDDAKALYLKVKAGHKVSPDLTRVGKLRLSLGLARISHMRFQWDDALNYWTEALAIVSKFTLRNGHTSAVILYSMSHVLTKLGDFEWSQRYWGEMERIEGVAGPGGCQFWIAGLRSYWYDYVRSAQDNGLPGKQQS